VLGYFKSDVMVVQCLFKVVLSQIKDKGVLVIHSCSRSIAPLPFCCLFFSFSALVSWYVREKEFMECTWLAIRLAILDLSAVVVTVAERHATVLYSLSVRSPAIVSQINGVVHVCPGCRCRPVFELVLLKSRQCVFVGHRFVL